MKNKQRRLASDLSVCGIMGFAYFYIYSHSFSLDVILWKSPFWLVVKLEGPTFQVWWFTSYKSLGQKCKAPICFWISVESTSQSGGLWIGVRVMWGIFKSLFSLFKCECFIILRSAFWFQTHLASVWDWNWRFRFNNSE